jgi:hypothetical protein
VKLIASFHVVSKLRMSASMPPVYAIMELKGTNFTRLFEHNIIRLKTAFVYRSVLPKRFCSRTPFGFEN